MQCFITVLGSDEGPIPRDLGPGYAMGENGSTGVWSSWVVVAQVARELDGALRIQRSRMRSLDASRPHGGDALRGLPERPRRPHLRRRREGRANWPLTNSRNARTRRESFVRAGYAPPRARQAAVRRATRVACSCPRTRRMEYLTLTHARCP